MADVHHQALLNGIAELFTDGKYSDLTIACENHQWHVHKAIICKASDVLEKECDVQMREGLSSVIEHRQFDAATVGRMVSYIYTRSYSVDEEDKLLAHKKDHDKSEEKRMDSGLDDINRILIAHVKTYGIGEYYQIPTLKSLAADRFCTATKRGFQLYGFIEVVETVEDCTSVDDRRLRDSLRDYTYAHGGQWAYDGDFVRDLAGKRVGRELAADLLQKSVRQHLEDSKTKDEELAQLRDTLAHKVKGEARAIEAKDNLVGALRRMPEDCHQRTCKAHFDPMTIDYANNQETEWRIRCKICQGLLVR